MQIIWLGHGSWRIETGDQVILIDPWLTCPSLPENRRDDAVAGATQILVTHGHFDHTADIAEVSQKTGAPVSGMYELANHLYSLGATQGNAFNKGGTIQFGEVRVTMVPASHSSSMQVGDRGAYMGSEIGFVIQAEDHCIYHSSDTTVMADMEWIAALYQPDIGILSAGGYYTMDMATAAWAARRYFDFKTVIPSHFRTFPALEQNIRALSEGLPGVRVIDPAVLDPITP